jgi:acetyl-CoA C-acetyltransferase
MSKAKAEELGPRVAGRDRRPRHGGRPDSSLQSQPANAIKRGLDKEGITAADLDLVEINEAFAAVGIHSRVSSAWTTRRSTSTAAPSRSATRSACPAPARAAPGPRAQAPRRRHRRAALCGGGGQGDALILRVPKA